MQKQIEKKLTLIEVHTVQHRIEKRVLTDVVKTYHMQEVTARAYLSGNCTMAKIADYFNSQYATISRWINGYEDKV